MIRHLVLLACIFAETGISQSAVLRTLGSIVQVSCNGDITSSLQSGINTLTSANGGIVMLSSGSCFTTAQVTIANDGASPVPHQVPITILGSGSHWAGIYSPTTGETVLDLRYSGSVGKLVSLGLGLLDIINITITNATSTDSLPFIFVTNTTTHIVGSSFIGNASSIPLPYAVVYGGQGSTAGGTTSNYFQGYGTVFERNYLSFCQGVLLQVNANAIVIQNNTFWNTCGGTAAIQDWNSSTYQNAGVYVAGNLIQMNNYTYGIAFYRTLGSVSLGNTFYDGGSFTSYYFFNSVANALPAMVLSGYYMTASKLCSGAGCPGFLTSSGAGVMSVFDSVGSYTNSIVKTGRLEAIGNRIVLRNGGTSDEVFDWYNPTGHTARMLPAQADGILQFSDSSGAPLLQQNADGSWKLQNTHAVTGYTYLETQAGAGQSTTPLGRWKDASGNVNSTIIFDGTHQDNPRSTASLVTCNTGNAGARSVVNDASVPVIGATLVSGGSSKAQVWCNGTNWTVTGI